MLTTQSHRMSEHHSRDRHGDSSVSRNGGGGGQIVTRVKQKASNIGHYIKHGLDAAGHSVKEEGERLYDKQRDRLVDRVNGAGKAAQQIAHALHAIKADALAEYADSAAKKIRRTGTYLEETDLQSVLDDAGKKIKEHEVMAVAGALAAGLLISRFLKARQSRLQTDDAETQE